MASGSALRIKAVPIQEKCVISQSHAVLLRPCGSPKAARAMNEDYALLMHSSAYSTARTTQLALAAEYALDLLTQELVEALGKVQRGGSKSPKSDRKRRR